MTHGSLSLIIISVTLSAVAQIAFKLGVSSQPPAVANSPGSVLVVLSSPGVLVGLALYGLGTILWLTALRQVELSQAYPFVGIGFALTTIAGAGLFGDVMSAQRLSGICLIFAGIVLIARS
jgi:multidrug transporter EmrE-like cation transporter